MKDNKFNARVYILLIAEFIYPLIEDPEWFRTQPFVTGKGVQNKGCRVGETLQFVVHTIPSRHSTANIDDLLVLVMGPGRVHVISLVYFEIFVHNFQFIESYAVHNLNHVKS